MDYRKLLGATQTMVLPYFGGPSVHATDRRHRVTERVAVGWWRFEIKGRHATPKAPAEPPALGSLPSARGHLVGQWLFTGGSTAERVFLMPAEEAPLLSPGLARRWASGDYVFESLDFLDEAEDAAHAALLAGATIADLKGARPSLRAAFGYAMVQRMARERGLQVSLREVLPQVHAVADGTLTSHGLLDEIESRVYRVNPSSTHRAVVSREQLRGTLADVEDRASTVLAAAGAQMVQGRQLGADQYEVTFHFMGETFIAVVDTATLHVFDAGICLSGADEMLGLDALPSVIAEAIDTDVLHITRR